MALLISAGAGPPRVCLARPAVGSRQAPPARGWAQQIEQMRRNMLQHQESPVNRASGQSLLMQIDLWSVCAIGSEPTRAPSRKKHVYPGFLAITFQELESMMTPFGL
jgi:hypothetical protein